jgi:hypothetical protein
MIVPFDDLELVYQSLRNSSRHISANFRASMRRTPNWAIQPWDVKDFSGRAEAARSAGSTLAADAGSRSIGFQFHRADVIDAARTGRASGTSMLLSLLESREYVTE